MGLVHRQRGFTLTEVLVTTVVIGVLAATMLPALMRQTNAADPARLASELGSIKTGIEIFGQNVRPHFPGDLEDLVNAVNATDVTIATAGGGPAGGAYNAAALPKWKGPYVAQTLAGGDAVTGNTAWRAGANGAFAADLEVCDLAAAGAACTPVATGPSAFVRIGMTGLSATEINELDVMIDGTAGLTAGLLRASGTDAFFYAVPFTP
jgi:prepilin-type N-terminal cleavage/methylation domain-containing protein